MNGSEYVNNIVVLLLLFLSFIIGYRLVVIIDKKNKHLLIDTYNLFIMVI